MRHLTALGFGLAGTLACLTAVPAHAANLGVQLSANVTHDSNIARASESVAAARGIDQADVIGDLLAVLDVNTQLGPQTAYITGTIGYQTFQQNSQFDGGHADLKAGVSRKVGRCDIGVSGAYASAQSNLADISFEEPDNILERRLVDATFGCSQLVGFAPTLRVSEEWVENSAFSRQESNSNTQAGRLGVTYRRPALGAISIYAEYQETEYPNRLVLVGGELVPDGYTVQTEGVTYERELGARLQGSVFGSYTTLQPELATVPDFEGFTYGGTLTYRMGSRITANFAFSRDVKPSDRLDSTYALTDALSLQATYALGHRVSLSVGGEYQDSQIEGANLQPGVDVTDDKTRMAFGAVNFKLNERISFAFDARVEDREADVAGFDYRSERVGVSAIAAF